MREWGVELRRLLVPERKGREMGYTENGMIARKKVRVGVSKRVAKCNLKKERTSSPASRPYPQATTRKEGEKFSLVYNSVRIQPTDPAFLLPFFLTIVPLFRLYSRRQCCLISPN